MMHTSLGELVVMGGGGVRGGSGFHNKDQGFIDQYQSSVVNNCIRGKKKKKKRGSGYNSRENDREGTGE